MYSCLLLPSCPLEAFVPHPSLARRRAPLPWQVSRAALEKRGREGELGAVQAAAVRRLGELLRSPEQERLAAALEDLTQPHLRLKARPPLAWQPTARVVPGRHRGASIPPHAHTRPRPPQPTRSGPPQPTRVVAQDVRTPAHP